MPVFERQKLDNGLRVLTAPMPHAQSVACFVMLAAGSRYEEQSNRGIAHFAEHMFFKGTRRRPSSRALTTLVDGIGGEFNAFTSKEYTGYYVRCAGADRDTALDVLIDMIRNSKFDPEEIEREKGVILEEMNMYFDTPRDYIGSVYEGLMFGDNPLGWETLGTKDTIRAANRDTFLDYVNQRYTPDRMVVGVSGMVGKNLVRRWRRCSAGSLPTGRGSSIAVLPTGDAGPYVRLHRKQSDQAQICIGVPSLPLEHPDRYALQLLATVLGTGMSSRLFLEVRERRGLAYYVYGSNHSYTDAGSLYAQAGVDLEADRRRDHRRSSTSSSAWPTRRCRRRSSRRRGRSRRGASCSTPSLRRACSCSGCAARCWRARRSSRGGSSPSSTRSRPRTSSASRRT